MAGPAKGSLTFPVRIATTQGPMPAPGARALIVTPTYNERENLEPFLAGVFRWAPEANVLIVDDASPDGTGVLADEIAAKDPRVTVMHRAGKLGLGSAYREAFAA